MSCIILLIIYLLSIVIVIFYEYQKWVKADDGDTLFDFVQFMVEYGSILCFIPIIGSIMSSTYVLSSIFSLKIKKKIFMTQEQKNNILEYVRRSIPDIARKCEVSDKEVILVMSEFIPCNIRNSSEDDFVIVQWPEIQELMCLEGFDINASLANDEWTLEKYGSSTYFVSKQWLEEMSKTTE